MPWERSSRGEKCGKKSGICREERAQGAFINDVHTRGGGVIAKIDIEREVGGISLYDAVTNGWNKFQLFVVFLNIWSAHYASN